MKRIDCFFEADIKSIVSVKLQLQCSSENIGQELKLCNKVLFYYKFTARYFLSAQSLC